MVEHTCRYLSFESGGVARSGAARRVLPAGSRRCIALLCACSHVNACELPVVEEVLRVQAAMPAAVGSNRSERRDGAIQRSGCPKTAHAVSAL